MIKRLTCLPIVAALLLLLMAPGFAFSQTGNPGMAPTMIEPGDSPAAEGQPSTDSTLGAVNSAFAMMRDGGLMLLPLAACSFLLFVFIFERAISLRRGRVIPKPFVRRFIQQLEEGQLDREEAMSRCRENRSPIAVVFAAAVMKWNKPSVEVEQAVIDSGERMANTLRRYLRLFNGISTISPLLGLLGTVVGMIRAFNMIASSDAMGRPELLASGISQALLTTAAGLVVAIPAIVAYLMFSSRVDRLVMDIDELGQQVVNAIASDGWREKPARKRRAKAA